MVLVYSYVCECLRACTYMCTIYIYVSVEICTGCVNVCTWSVCKCTEQCLFARENFLKMTLDRAQGQLFKWECMTEGEITNRRARHEESNNSQRDFLVPTSKALDISQFKCHSPIFSLNYSNVVRHFHFRLCPARSLCLVFFISLYIYK